MPGTQDSEFLHQIAKSYAKEKGISEESAIREIRDRFTFNSEIHMKIPSIQGQLVEKQHTGSLEHTAELLSKGNAKLGSSNLEIRRIELEEKRIEFEQNNQAVAAQQRQDELTIQRDQLVLDREQIRSDQKIKSEELKLEREIRHDEMKFERENARSDRVFAQLLAAGKNAGNDSEGILKMMESQNTAQKEYFKEINTVKENERNHTDKLRTDLLKIEADRDVELTKLKSSSDQKTSDAIDALIQKIDENKPGSGEDGGDDFLDKYNTQIEKVEKFQKSLTTAGLKTLESQGVDVEALKKAHNIATESAESTFDKIIGVGRDLYEKTIKPSLEDTAKNGSGGGIDAPSGLETAFETPDLEIEDRIRAEQELGEIDNQISLEKQNQLEKENTALTQQYETALHNKARQYGIATNGLSCEELDRTINYYENIMNTPFNSAPQIKSIDGLRRMALELNINTSGKTVAQVESEVIQAQQIIEQQLDSLPDNSTGHDNEQATEPVQEPPAQAIELPPEPTPEQESESDEPSLGEIIDYNTNPNRPPERKRTITAQHTTPGKKKTAKKQDLIKFTLSNGTEIHAKSPHSAATKLAKEYKGTSELPVTVELTHPNGNKYVYETRIDKVTRHGKIIDMPRAKKVKQ